jgi:hypothetical protein
MKLEEWNADFPDFFDQPDQVNQENLRPTKIGAIQ